MEIVKANGDNRVDVLDLPPGVVFEAQGRTFVRVYEIETAILSEHDGHDTLRNIAGVDLESGGYFCVSKDAGIDAAHRLVSVVPAKVVVGE